MRRKANNRHKLLTIVAMGLITGTLDAIAAVIISPQTPDMVFKYIASGYFNQAAYMEDHMVLWGIFFHYVIAMIISVALWAIYPKFRKGIKNKYITGIIFGLLVWIAMNFAVLPLTSVPKKPDNVPVDKILIIKSFVALIICVGLPAAIISERYYTRKAKRAARRRVRNHYS